MITFLLPKHTNYKTILYRIADLKYTLDKGNISSIGRCLRLRDEEKKELKTFMEIRETSKQTLNEIFGFILADPIEINEEGQ